MVGIRFVSEAGATGYGIAARGYLSGLRQAGVPLTWTPMVVGNSWDQWLEPRTAREYDDPEFADLCNRPVEYDTVIVHLLPRYYRRWRQLEPTHKMIGFAVWETPKIPLSWHDDLRAMDGLLTVSQWNRKAFEASVSNRPVGVVPHVPPPESATQPLSIPGVTDCDYLFYSIGNWTERKGMDLTLESYLQAFTADDPVVLLLKTRRWDESRIRWGGIFRDVLGRWLTVDRAVTRARGRFKHPPRVLLVTDELSAHEMAGLHARGDCYVSLNRGEGWGMGSYEAACVGRPVIATGYGAPLEYLSADLASHVRFDLVPVEPTGHVEREIFGPGQCWADPDIDHGSRLMRDVFEHQNDARDRASGLKIRVRQRFNERDTIDQLLKFVESLSI